MSKLIKLIPIILVSTLISGCYPELFCDDDCDDTTYSFFDFPEFFYDDQGDLVISY